MRIRLVEPAPAGHNVYDVSLLPRLGLPLIATMLGRAGHDARCYCEVLAPIDLDDCLRADLVGISATTATAPAAYRLADLLESAGVTVALGGPHVTFATDEALAHASYVVRGEGEATALELVATLQGDRPLEGVLGLSHLGAGGEPCHHRARPRCSQAEFEQLPVPRLDLVAGHDRLRTAPVMTQWGCPFDCEFCSVTAMFSRSVRHRRPDQVVAELAALGGRRVFFYDDNFVASKPRAVRLLEAMRAAGTTPEFLAQCRADAALRPGAGEEPDVDFLALLRGAGCSMVMLGLESASDESLHEAGKRQRVATIERAVGAFHDHGIAVHGMFVAGFDNDTAGAAGAAAQLARRLRIDTFQLMVETPLPGTRLFARVAADRRLLTEDWSLFDGHHVVMRPALTTPLELQLSVLEAMRTFYSWPRIMSSGLTAGLAHLPSLARAARPRLLGHLPALARAAWSHRTADVAPMLAEALPPAVARRLSGSLWLPALRFYARRQLAAWWQQDPTRRHLAFLAGLDAA